MDFFILTVCLTILSLSKGETGKCHCSKPDRKGFTYICHDIQTSVIPKTEGCDRKISKIIVVDSNIENVTNKTFRKLNISSVTSLELVRCNIRHFQSHTLSGFPLLQSLNLSGNNLREAADLLVVNTRLQVLRLDGNPLIRIDANTFHPSLQKTLQEMYLNNCSIEYIGDDALKNFSRLRVLSIFENNLNSTGFLRNCRKLKKHHLETLNISHNFVEDTSIFSPMSNNSCLRKIRWLIMDGNPLRFKEGQIFSSQTLKTLSLRNLKKETPFPVLNLPSLCSLDLTGNYRLSNIQVDTFSNLTNLRNLKMSGSNLPGHSPSDLQKLFQSLQSIESLDLTNTSIKGDVGKAFRSLTTLGSLYLDFNGITKISNAFSTLSNLRKLYVRNNNISVIKQKDLPANKHLKFDFSGNPFHCTCAIADFRIYCGQHFSQVLSWTRDNYFCKDPKEYAGKSFWTFQPRYSDCHGFNPYIMTAIVICVVFIIIVLVLTFLSSNKHGIQNYLRVRKLRSGYTQMSGSSAVQES